MGEKNNFTTGLKAILVVIVVVALLAAAPVLFVSALVIAKFAAVDFWINERVT